MMNGGRQTETDSVRWCLAALVLLLVAGLLPANASPAEFKNVIVMVPDGAGSAHTTVTRWYKGAPLALDRMLLGGVRTYSADSLITDSAPAATAFATGHKSSNRAVGVLPGQVTIPGPGPVSGATKFKPVATVLEAAKLMGKSVGIVTTAAVQDATTAAFTSHWPDRHAYDEIARQQVYLGVDIVLGGGKRYLLPKEKGGSRTDGADLTELLKDRGYAVVATREEMARATGRRIWGMFTDGDMTYELDRRVLKVAEPTLAEMTAKAIETLSRNPKGFFLLVEGSKVDWASHANDPVAVVSEVLAFDEAVDKALSFAARDRATLVLAFADHGSGGMSVGSRSTNRTYATLSYEQMLAPLKKARLTGEGVEKTLSGDLTEANVRKVVSEQYGVDDLTAEEVAAIQNAKRTRLNRVLGPIISARCGIGWTTTGHTGEDGFLYLYGVRKSPGMVDNTDLATMIAQAMGTDLGRVDRRLFADAQEAFGKIGASVSLERSDPARLMLLVDKGGRKAELPVSTNLIRLNGPAGAEFRMEGITVYVPGADKVYVPLEAIRLFERGRKDGTR